MVMSAIDAGNRARKAKNATPAASIGTLSALASASERLTTCFHPSAGISAGVSASLPGRPELRADTFPEVFRFVVRVLAMGPPRSSWDVLYAIPILR